MVISLHLKRIEQITGIPQMLAITACPQPIDEILPVETYP
jgi:hypothetical protein